jgi:ankyrin repeat protein
MVAGDPPLMRLLRAIAAGNMTNVLRMLAASPSLAAAQLERGATRQLLPALVRELVSAGADVNAKNRHGARPLHYAADGSPGSASWNPDAQASTIAVLIEVGADPNGTDVRGVSPWHRAVRTRCVAAVSRGGTGGQKAKAEQLQILRLLELRGATL